MLWLWNLWNRKRFRAAARSVAKRSRKRSSRLNEEIHRLRAELARCEENLETEKVKSRVLEAEVQLLSHVHARDVRR